MSLLDLSVIPPLLGNLLIINAPLEIMAKIGCYIYFLGMDMVMLALIQFTVQYCEGTGDGQKVPKFIYGSLVLDAVQLLVNPFSGHAFTMETIMVQDQEYFRFVPHWGQYFHRTVDYFIFAAVVVIYVLVIKRTTRIYTEKYAVILVSMLIAGAWQTFYIFSRIPIDRSMIGFGVFGILVFYFAIVYRPLRLLDRMLSNIASDMSQALYVFDPNNKCIWVNGPGAKLAGITPDELEKAEASLKEIIGDFELGEEDWSENKTIGVGERETYYSIEKRSFNDDIQRRTGSFLIVRDNTEEQQRIKREFYSSIHDSLTGLYSKQYMFECIRKMLDSQPDITYYAVFIDVMNFKIVNDVFSTGFGDLALKQIADWVRKDMNDRCVYGRLAGDTFGVFVPKEDFDAQAIEKELASFIVTDSAVEHHIVIHLGVYEVTERDIDVSVMFDRAHLALTTISSDYNIHIAYYDAQLRERVIWNQNITSGLSEAISRMQIRPYLQPITDVNGKVVGAEALVRWIHPEHGFMTPNRFIPVLEKNGMIIELDRHMWRCACEILSKWKGTHDDMFISVNISPKDFYFIDVVSEIKFLVREYDLEPAKLRIEITETVMMNESEDRMRVLDEMRNEGFIVEMDDFGSGYSSLNLLKDMPVDVLKIDMKFLSSSNKEKAKTIVRNIIKLANELGLFSLTEGIETAQQYNQLSDMGCHLFQGYYFAKPMPVEEFEAFTFKN